MKYMHRTKTLAAYDGARICLKNNMGYPAYMLLKEAARGVLSYIVEDKFDKDISEKMKLKSLMSFIDSDMVDQEDIDKFNSLIELEEAGLEAILGASVEELIDVKRSIKHVIAEYMKEPI